MALDQAGAGPSVRVVVLKRPCEEVVLSFMRKTNSRNHWQHPDDWQQEEREDEEEDEAGRGRSEEAGAVGGVGGAWRRKKGQRGCWQLDKTWDRTFPNMSPPADPPTTAAAAATPAASDAAAAAVTAWSKERAIRAYWELYYAVVSALVARFPEQVRCYDMAAVLGEERVQREMLSWAGGWGDDSEDGGDGEAVVNTGIVLNKGVAAAGSGGGGKARASARP